MTITFEAGSYKLVATRQHNTVVWLIHEYSGPQAKPINTYADTTSGLLETLAEAGAE